MDIFFEISKYLPIQTVIALSATCSSMNSNQLWLFLYTRDYNGQLHNHHSSYKQLYKRCFQLTKVKDFICCGRSLDEIMNTAHLYLSYEDRLTIPTYFCQLTNLQTLFLSKNFLTDLPYNVSKLINLQLLYLSSNQLVQPPAVIYELTNLRRLCLEHNRITNISSNITRLTNLVD